MREMKWVPGPYRMRHEDGPPFTDIMVGSIGDGRLLATVYPEHYRGGDHRRDSADALLRSYAEAEATARLLAAAPDLYEAVVLLLSSRSHHPDPGVVERRVIEGLSKGLAAIMKAGGSL